MKAKLKRLLGEGIYRLGISRLRWFLLPRGLYILNYHRIGNAFLTSFDRGVFSCTEQRFREHLEQIKDRFEVLNLDRLKQVIQSRSFKTSKPHAMITFDDGYFDNYSIAYPLLREYQLPAIFFLPTNFIGSEIIPWWDEIAWIVRHAKVQEFRVPGWSEPFSLSFNRDVVIRKVLSWARSPNPMSMDEKVSLLREVCGTPPFSKTDKQFLFMSWSHAKELLDGGMDIGSHTHTHRILSHLPESEQEKEMTISKEILESRLGRSIKSIAYPVGGRDAYSSETVQLATKIGYQFGFNYTGYRQNWPIQDARDISRLQIDDYRFHSRFREMVSFPQLAYSW